MTDARECLCPTWVTRCAHLDRDVVQAWRSEQGSYVVQGPYGGGPLGYPVRTFTAGDFEAEWAHRLGRLRHGVASAPL